MIELSSTYFVSLGFIVQGIVLNTSFHAQLFYQARFQCSIILMKFLYMKRRWQLLSDDDHSNVEKASNLGVWRGQKQFWCSFYSFYIQCRPCISSFKPAFINDRIIKYKVKHCLISVFEGILVDLSIFLFILNIIHRKLMAISKFMEEVNKFLVKGCD